MKIKHIREASLERYATPVLDDESLDYWAWWYQANRIETRGVRFIAFLQQPLQIAHGLAWLDPTVKEPDRPLGRRLSKADTFQVAEFIFRERNQALAR